MKRTISLFLIISLALAASARGEETTKRLANGVDVVVVHGDSVARVLSKVAVVVAYRAGARDEARSDSGIAHLVEHLHARAATETFAANETEQVLERYGPTRTETLHALTLFASVVPESELRIPLEVA